MEQINNLTADEKAMTTDYKFSLEEILELQKIVSEKIYYLPKHSLTDMRWRIFYILSNKKALLLGKRKQIEKHCAVGNCDDLTVNNDRCEEHNKEFLEWLNNPKRDEVLIQ